MAVFEELDIEDEDELLRLMQLRKDDPQLNLAERYQNFAARNPVLTEQRFGFVRKIVKHGFTVIGIRELGLAYTVGLWYSYSFPELMLAAGSSGAEMERMNAALQDTADQLWRESPVSQQVWRSDPRGFLEPRAYRLGALAFAALRAHDLRTDAWHNADADFLKRYPFGYGWHFYQQFADENEVPILCAQLIGKHSA
jgi:hypothetical protein